VLHKVIKKAPVKTEAFSNGERVGRPQQNLPAAGFARRRNETKLLETAKRRELFFIFSTYFSSNT